MRGKKKSTYMRKKGGAHLLLQLVDGGVPRLMPGREKKRGGSV